MVELVIERELFFHVGEGSEQDLAEVGEDGGVARRDAVLRDGDKEFAEDVVDIGGGEEITVERDGDLGTQALRLAGLQFFPGMERTQRRVVRVARHAAATAIGKLKLATGGDTSTGILIRHGNLLESGFEIAPNRKRFGSGSRWKEQAGQSSVEIREGKKIAARKGGGKAQLRLILPKKEYHCSNNSVNTYLW